MLAIVLDRLSQAWATRSGAPTRGRHAYLLAALGTLALASLLALLLPPLARWPDAARLSSGTSLNDAVAYVNVTYFDQIEAVKDWVLLHLLVPLKRLMLALPWRLWLWRWRSPVATGRPAAGVAGRRADACHRADGLLGRGDDHRLSLRLSRRCWPW